MSILSELNGLLVSILPVETGVFSGVPPDEYIVITPMADVFGVHADNFPQTETQEARLSLFSKNNYLERKNQVTKTLLSAEFVVTGRRYIGFESDTGYHHYNIDCEKFYMLNTDNSVYLSTGTRILTTGARFLLIREG